LGRTCHSSEAAEGDEALPGAAVLSERLAARQVEYSVPATGGSRANCLVVDEANVLLQHSVEHFHAVKHGELHCMRGGRLHLDLCGCALMTWPKNMYLTRQSEEKRMQRAMNTDVRLGMRSSTGTSFTPNMTLAGEISSCIEAPAAAN
jgi:hypothetical protein